MFETILAGAMSLPFVLLHMLARLFLTIGTGTTAIMDSGEVPWTNNPVKHLENSGIIMSVAYPGFFLVARKPPQPRFFF